MGRVLVVAVVFSPFAAEPGWLQGAGARAASSLRGRTAASPPGLGLEKSPLSRCCPLRLGLACSSSRLTAAPFPSQGRLPPVGVPQLQQQKQGPAGPLRHGPAPRPGGRLPRGGRESLRARAGSPNSIGMEEQTPWGCWGGGHQLASRPPRRLPAGSSSHPARQSPTSAPNALSFPAP